MKFRVGFFEEENSPRSLCDTIALNVSSIGVDREIFFSLPVTGTVFLYEMEIPMAEVEHNAPLSGDKKESYSGYLGEIFPKVGKFLGWSKI